MGWQLIQSYNVGDGITAAPASSVTFSNIPQTYKTLKVVVSARTDLAAASGDNVYLQFNGDTGANYSFKRLMGDGSTASSNGASSNAKYFLAGATDASTATTNTFSSIEVSIPNYSGNTTKVGSVDSVSENNATQSYQMMNATIWTGTSAITSISAKSYDNANFIFGSTFTLYGLI